jgi:hypothetical protein
LFGGHFIHENIRESNPVRNEVHAGRVFHYFTGGSVALIYPAFYLVFSVPMPADHLIPSLAFGLATVVLPWFLLFPAYGYGFFGIRGPARSRPLIAPIIEHMLYGLGIGVVLSVAS